MRQIFDKIKTINIYLLLAIVSILISNIWLRHGPFFYHDFSFSLNPLAYINNIFLWNESYGSGNYSGLGSGYIFINLYLMFLTSIKNFLITELLLFSSILWFSLSSSFFVFNRFIKNSLIAFLVSFFYIFNIFSMNRLYDGHLFLFVIYSVFPIFIYHVHQYLRFSKSGSLFYLTLIAFIFGSGFGNLPMSFGTLYIPLVIYVLVAFLTYKEFENLFKKVILVAASVLLANLYWIVPVGHYYVEAFSSSNVFVNQQFGTGWVDIVWQRGSIFNLIRLTSHWLWDGSWAGDTWYYYKSFYDSFLMVVLSFVPFVLALIYLATSRKLSFFSRYLLVLLFAQFFLANGTQKPFGFLWKLFYENIPLFSLFRAPPTKFLGPAVFVIALFVGHLINSIKSRRRKFLGGILFFVLTGVLAWPMLSGNIFYREQRGAWPHRNIPYFPEDHLEIANIINSNPDSGRIISYPDSYFGFYNLGYKLHEGTDLLRTLLNHSFISCVGATSQCLYETSIYTASEENLSYLSFLGVEWVIVRKDLYSYSSEPPSFDVKVPANSFTKYYEGALLELYRINKPLPKIFGLANVARVKTLYLDDSGYLQDLVSTSIDYKKISPVLYEFNLGTSGYDGGVVFLSSYSPYWRLIPNEGSLLKSLFLDIFFKKTSTPAHSMIFEYANLWEIDEREFATDYYIFFWPQLLFWSFFSISSIFTLSMSYLVLEKNKNVI